MLQTQSTRVGRNLLPGYRLAYYKHFSEPGEDEVRLYNRDGQLIGRRGFRIRGS